MKYAPKKCFRCGTIQVHHFGSPSQRVLAIPGRHTLRKRAIPGALRVLAIPGRQNRRAFSLIEILISLVFVSIAFLPIYNLFRFGQKGTMSNVKEIEATNCASDLLNFVRELSYNDVDRVMTAKGKDEWTFPTDKEISAADAFPAWTQVAGKDFVRSLYLKRFKGSTGLINAIVGGINNLVHGNPIVLRRTVPNFLAEVKITFKKSLGPGQDDVKLYTIVMD